MTNRPLKLWHHLVIVAAILLYGYSSTGYAADININVLGFIKPNSLTTQINAVRKATAADTVYIHIRSEGGRVSEAQALCVAIHDSKASQIISVITDYANSSGAEIATCTDKIMLSDDATILWHLGTILAQGKEPAKDLTLGMKLNTLTHNEELYMIQGVEILKYELKKMGISKTDIYTALHEKRGLTLTGSSFRIANPEMLGLRKDAELYGYARSQSK